MAQSGTLVKLLKDVSAQFGCKGDIYRFSDDELKALDAYVKRFKLGTAYEVVKTDATKAATTVETDVKAAASAVAGKAKA